MRTIGIEVFNDRYFRAHVSLKRIRNSNQLHEILHFRDFLCEGAFVRRNGRYSHILIRLNQHEANKKEREKGNSKIHDLEGILSDSFCYRPLRDSD